MLHRFMQLTPPYSGRWLLQRMALWPLSNPWSQILRYLGYVDANTSTEPHHPSRIYCRLFGLTLSFELAEPESSFLMPHLIHLPVARTAPQNKQSFEHCARIRGQMLNRCWLSELRIHWPKSASIPKSQVYQKRPTMCFHSNTPHSTFKASGSGSLSQGQNNSFLFMYCHVLLPTALQLYQQRSGSSQHLLIFAVTELWSYGNSAKDKSTAERVLVISSDTGRNGSTEASSTVVLPRVRKEDWHHSHVCPINVKRRPADGELVIQTVSYASLRNQTVVLERACGIFTYSATIGKVFKCFFFMFYISYPSLRPNKVIEGVLKVILKVQYNTRITAANYSCCRLVSPDCERAVLLAYSAWKLGVVLLFTIRPLDLACYVQ